MWIFNPPDKSIQYFLVNGNIGKFIFVGRFTNPGVFEVSTEYNFNSKHYYEVKIVWKYDVLKFYSPIHLNFLTLKSDEWNGYIYSIEQNISKEEVDRLTQNFKPRNS